jgi:hypothetical protein
MGLAKEEFGLEFHDHSRRAKRRAVGIDSAKTKPQRVTAGVRQIPAPAAS